MTTRAEPPRAYPFAFREAEVSPNYAELRREQPVAWVKLPYGEPGWLVTRYADVRTVMTDPRFSRAIAQGLDQPRMRAENMNDGIMGMDPPDHSRLRSLVAKAFTARRVEKLRANVQRLADRLSDDMQAQGPPSDLVEHFARPLPVSVICELLGVPYEDYPMFSRWTEAFTNEQSAMAEVMTTIGPEMDRYMSRLIAQRRERPTDDLLGALVRARDEGDKLTETELIDFTGAGLLTAGTETVSAGLPSMIFVLSRRPEALALLREEPDVMPGAVEELLRFTPINTAAMFPRYPLEDVELSGVTVRAGEPVLPSIAAANRDPEVFDRPDELDLRRARNPHLTFGHGPHHCVGAQLARIELQVALRTLLDRFPRLRLADGVRWRFGVVVRGPATMPVTW
ncbi:cytochrome P450 [Natronosporangium hydrolyticum]|uniref:Cytochrome P450 n=1 Tax=Natronosporangium hydrolyticum TaxID=2811111 RepID=A0A895YDX6_9ACTN|nr:cytochrome P450 [Natronosporangium hydrolyticum]QSB16014.1 cytochrome P450 [Natronosporangium hydrolyticum]